MLIIYIMEDNPVFSATLKEILRAAYPNARVKIFSECASFLAEVAAHPPHLIFMDINLPKIDGLSLTRKIRETNNAVNIIVMTIYDDPEYAAVAIDMGADGFISKELITAEEVLKFTQPIHPGPERSGPADEG